MDTAQETAITREVKVMVDTLLHKVVIDSIHVYSDALGYVLEEIPIEDGSLSDPELYVAEFMRRIEEYPFISSTDSGFSVNAPTTDSFKWDGITPLYIVSIGLVGTYYEMPEDIFNVLNERKLLSDDDLVSMSELYMDTESTTGTSFLLVPEEVADRLAKYIPGGKKLVKFPFSDMPGIDILAEGNKRLRKELDSDKITSMITNKLKRYST